MTTPEFWQAVYVAAIRSGSCGTDARTKANAAVCDMEQRPSGVPREEWMGAVKDAHLTK